MECTEHLWAPDGACGFRRRQLADEADHPGAIGTAFHQVSEEDEGAARWALVEVAFEAPKEPVEGIELGVYARIRANGGASGTRLCAVGFLGDG